MTLKEERELKKAAKLEAEKQRIEVPTYQRQESLTMGCRIQQRNL